MSENKPVDNNTVQPKTLDELVAATKSGLQTNRLDSKPVYFVFDTGAVTDMYRQVGNCMFDYIDASCRGIITPEAVVSELENQRDCKRAHDDGSALCPYELMNLIYVETAEDQVIRLDSSPTEEEEKELRKAMASSELNDSDNRRLGKGDMSVVNCARVFSQDAYCVVVSPDTDVAMVLSSLGVEKVGYLKPSDYLALRNAA